MMMMRMILPNLDQVVGIIVVDDIYVDMVDVVDVVVESSLRVSLLPFILMRTCFMYLIWWLMLLMWWLGVLCLYHSKLSWC